MITATDFFCGAGGSSTGMVAAGVKVQLAANHWQLAIDTHSTNHPDAEHDCNDLRAARPERYKRTDIAWFSPECTNHSLAKGRKRKNLSQLSFLDDNGYDPEEERSRATMREVVEFTAYHRYEMVIVENVVDIRYWTHYDEWLTTMMGLGYEHRACYFNAQFFGVPQSRDRVYIVFWRKGLTAPDLDFRPAAWCQRHGQIEARQSFKKAGFHWGRYGKNRQYLYVCPECGSEVAPAHTPAYTAIDWSIPSQKIGDRQKPLKPKTTQRILAGLEKFKDRALLVDLGHSHAADNGKVHDVAGPAPTQTGQQRIGLIEPFIAELRANAEARGIDDPLSTLVASAHHHWLVTPPLLVMLKGDRTALSVDEPMSTLVASACQHWLLTLPFMLSGANQESEGRPVDEPMYATATGYNARLVIPPFIASLNHSNLRNTPVDEPLRAIMPHVQPTLVTPPFVMAYYGNAPTYAHVGEPIPTMTTVERHALVTPEQMLRECGFRMLEPHELKRGMSFPESYIILGNKREQVKQIGNAVACNVAQWIVSRCVAALEGKVA